MILLDHFIANGFAQIFPPTHPHKLLVGWTEVRAFTI